jgi:hypothetical protein
MADFADPSRERGGKKPDPDDKDHPRGDQAPKHKRRAHGEAGWKIGGTREMLVR